MPGPSAAKVAAGDSISARRFRDLQVRLEAFNFTEPLTLDSVPLVESLFSDLVKTTESFQELKGQYERICGDIAIWQSQVEPLKKENARLVRENNRLHLTLIHEGEEYTKRERELKHSSRQNDSALADLKFINQQLQHKVRQQEKQTDALKKQLNSALLNARDAHRSVLNHSSIEVSSAPDVGESNDIPKPSVDVCSFDLLRSADERIAGLERDVLRCRHEVEAAEEELHHAKQTASSYQKEIHRLQEAMNTHILIPTDEKAANNSKSSAENNARIIEHQHSQIEFMHKQLQTARQELELFRSREEEGQRWEQEKAVLNKELQASESQRHSLESELRVLREKVDEAVKHHQQGTTVRRVRVVSPNRSSAKPEPEKRTEEKAGEREAGDSLIKEADDVQMSEMEALKDHIVDLEEALLRGRAREEMLQLAVVDSEKRVEEALELLETTEQKILSLRDELKAKHARIEQLEETSRQLMEQQQQSGAPAPADVNNTSMTEAEDPQPSSSMSLEHKLQVAREILQEKEGEVQRLEEEVQNLNDALEATEEDRENAEKKAIELQEQLKALQSDQKQREEQAPPPAADANTPSKKKSDAYVSSLETELENVRRQLVETQGHLQRIDGERDDVQAQLDECQEQLSSTQAKRLHWESQYQSQSSVLRDAQSSIQRYMVELSDRQKEVNALNEQLSHVGSQQKEWTERETYFKKELEAAALDLQQLTSENQRLNGDLIRSTESGRQMQDSIADREREIHRLESQKRTLTEEYKQLQSAYQQVCGEVDRVSRQARQSEQTFQQVQATCQLLQEEIRRQHAALMDADSQLQESERMRILSDQRVEQLSRAVDELNSQLDDQHHEKMHLIQDVDASKQVNTRIATDHQRYQHEVARLDAELISTRQRLESVQCELSAAKAQVELERQRSIELEQLCGRLRREKLNFEHRATVLETEVIHLRKVCSNQVDMIGEMDVERVRSYMHSSGAVSSSSHSRSSSTPKGSHSQPSSSQHSGVQSGVSSSVGSTSSPAGSAGSMVESGDSVVHVVEEEPSAVGEVNSDSD